MECIDSEILSDSCPHFGQVTEHLPPPGSFHWQQLVCLKTGVTQQAPKMRDFLEVHFDVVCRCTSQSSSGQHLLRIFSNYINPSGRTKKKRKLFICPLFTWVKAICDTVNPMQVCLLPMCVCALAPASVFCVPPIWRTHMRYYPRWQKSALWWPLRASDIILSLAKIKYYSQE